MVTHGFLSSALKIKIRILNTTSISSVILFYQDTLIQLYMLLNAKIPPFLLVNSHCLKLLDTPHCYCSGHSVPSTDPSPQSAMTGLTCGAAGKHTLIHNRHKRACTHALLRVLGHTVPVGDCCDYFSVPLAFCTVATLTFLKLSMLFPASGTLHRLLSMTRMFFPSFTSLTPCHPLANYLFLTVAFSDLHLSHIFLIYIFS